MSRYEIMKGFPKLTREQEARLGGKDFADQAALVCELMPVLAGCRRKPCRRAKACVAPDAEKVPPCMVLIEAKLEIAKRRVGLRTPASSTAEGLAAFAARGVELEGIVRQTEAILAGRPPQERVLSPPAGRG